MLAEKNSNKLLNFLIVYVFNYIIYLLFITIFFSFSVLLQTQDNMIMELKIDSAHLLELYTEFLLNAEGKCFRFCNIVISHRYNLHK